MIVPKPVLSPIVIRVPKELLRLPMISEKVSGDQSPSAVVAIDTVMVCGLSLGVKDAVPDPEV